jgi:hypothetical protein
MATTVRKNIWGHLTAEPAEYTDIEKLAIEYTSKAIIEGVARATHCPFRQGNGTANMGWDMFNGKRFLALQSAGGILIKMSILKGTFETQEAYAKRMSYYGFLPEDLVERETIDPKRS